ncbi:hypothetical protein GCM10023089_00430 [Quisquiliibacterium transsilvanicum]
MLLARLVQPALSVRRGRKVKRAPRAFRVMLDRLDLPGLKVRRVKRAPRAFRVMLAQPAPRAHKVRPVL